MRGLVSGEVKVATEESVAHELTEARGFSAAVTLDKEVCRGSDSDRGMTSRERIRMRGRSKAILWVRMRSRRSARSC